jgi:hypothetical protein
MRNLRNTRTSATLVASWTTTERRSSRVTLVSHAAGLCSTTITAFARRRRDKMKTGKPIGERTWRNIVHPEALAEHVREASAYRTVYRQAEEGIDYGSGLAIIAALLVAVYVLFSF